MKRDQDSVVLMLQFSFLSRQVTRTMSHQEVSYLKTHLHGTYLAISLRNLFCHATKRIS